MDREVRRYRECGIDAYGFARARCADCRHDFLVALTCIGADCARLATPAAWLRTRCVWSITSSVPFRCGNGSSWCRNACVGTGKASRARSTLCCPTARHQGTSAPEQRRRQLNLRTSRGGVSFIRRSGAALNRHVRSHCCIIDGLFEPGASASGLSEAVRFRPRGGTDAGSNRPAYRADAYPGAGGI